MNPIQDKRTEIRQFFDATSKIDGDSIYAISESGLYYFETEQYLQNDTDRNWIISKIMIFDTEKATCIFEYFTDHDVNVFAWINIENVDYLLFPKFLGGYSIFNTDTQELHSFYTEEEPFIWQKIEFDSINNQLEVEGNYWACPTELITYNCSKITQLPYPVLKKTILKIIEKIIENNN